MSDHNIKIQKEFIEILNSHKFKDLKKLVSKELIDHDPISSDNGDYKSYIDFFKKLNKSFPDLFVKIDHINASEDFVNIAFTITGTHKNEFRGVSATGKSICVRGVQIGKYRDGKLVERWGSNDELGIIYQIGVQFSKKF